MVVRVDTDVGISGWGAGGGGIAAAEVINRHLRELLVGRSINSIEDVARLWDDQYKASLPYGRSGVAVMAISGVDLALWDVLGRAEGKSVCDLLGGRQRDEVRAYATGPDCAWYRDWGFNAHKSSQTRQGSQAADAARVLEWAEGARQTLGEDALLMIDAYMSWSPDFAVAVARQLAPFNIYWFEDVLLPDDLDGLAALRPQIHPILLAGGEHEFTARDFGHIARMRALDLWQPDVTWCGGLTAALRIAKLAQAHSIPVVPPSRRRDLGAALFGGWLRRQFGRGGYGPARCGARQAMAGGTATAGGLLGTARRPGIWRRGERGAALGIRRGTQRRENGCLGFKTPKQDPLFFNRQRQ